MRDLARHQEIDPLVELEERFGERFEARGCEQGEPEHECQRDSRARAERQGLATVGNPSWLHSSHEPS